MLGRDKIAFLLPTTLAALGVVGIALRVAGVSWGDFADLPTETQRTVGYLLILPAGALLTAVVRTMIGFQTFGTLTPTLLAASTLYCDATTVAVVFVLVLVVGLGGRALLGRLRLLMGPRLGVVLTVLVGCLAAAIALLGRWGVRLDPAGAMMPLVVLTMIVERFTISIEENGLAPSVRLLVATLVVAAACRALLGWAAMGRWALAYPEAELIVAAGLVVVGRYAGYRLTELWRFGELARGPQERP